MLNHPQKFSQFGIYSRPSRILTLMVFPLEGSLIFPEMPHVPARVDTLIYLNITFLFLPCDTIPLIKAIPQFSLYYRSTHYSRCSSNSISFMKKASDNPHPYVLSLFPLNPHKPFIGLLNSFISHFVLNCSST